jgi:hypothetical protein
LEISLIEVQTEEHFQIKENRELKELSILPLWKKKSLRTIIALKRRIRVTIKLWTFSKQR